MQRVSSLSVAPRSSPSLDSCGICRVPTSPYLHNCRNLCDAGRRIDDCGNCLTAGSSGWNGCVDCAAVPYGPAEVDACGVCAVPGSDDWNSCPTLGCDGVNNSGTMEPNYGLLISFLLFSPHLQASSSTLVENAAIPPTIASTTAPARATALPSHRSCFAGMVRNQGERCRESHPVCFEISSRHWALHNFTLFSL